jgi:hypothetical protein
LKKKRSKEPLTTTAKFTSSPLTTAGNPIVSYRGELVADVGAELDMSPSTFANRAFLFPFRSLPPTLKVILLLIPAPMEAIPEEFPTASLDWPNEKESTLLTLWIRASVLDRFKGSSSGVVVGVAVAVEGEEKKKEVALEADIRSFGVGVGVAERLGMGTGGSSEDGTCGRLEIGNKTSPSIFALALFLISTSLAISAMPSSTFSRSFIHTVLPDADAGVKEPRW